MDLSQGAVLEKNQTYVVEVMRKPFDLPVQVHAYTNNKSTSGRTNIWVRALVDGLPRFDRIPEGYSGQGLDYDHPAILVRARPGRHHPQPGALPDGRQPSQRSGTRTYGHGRLGLVYNSDGFAIKPELDKGILLTADLSKSVVGYSAIVTDREVDLTSSVPHVAEEFFEPVYASNGEVCLERGKFYIMSTCEFLRGSRPFCRGNGGLRHPQRRVPLPLRRLL